MSEESKNDLVKEARELLAKATEGPWFAAFDKAEECGPHKNSGLALVDTGRENDWPIARLCEWHNAKLIAKVPELLSALCNEVERLQGERDGLDAAVTVQAESIETFQSQFRVMKEAIEAGIRWIEEFHAFRPTTELKDLVVATMRSAITPKRSEQKP